MAERKNPSKKSSKEQEELNFNALIPKKESLDTIARKVIKAKDSKALFDLVDEFRTVSLKKELVRVVKLQEFSDLADNEIGKRLSGNPERLRNSELVEFSGLLQNSIDRANKQIDSIRNDVNVEISANTVNLTKNEYNVNMPTASREKISNIVMALLKQKGIAVPEDSSSETIVIEEADVKNTEEAIVEDMTNVVHEEESKIELRKEEDED